MNEIETLDGRFGEAYTGDSPNGSHINLVIAARGSAVYASAVRTLTSPSPGFVPFLACMGLDNVIRPATVVISKLPIENERYERIFYGAGQLGIAQGVMDAVKDGVLDENNLGDICLLAACWIDPGAKDETKVRLYTRDAMFRAIRNALTPISKESVNIQLQSYETARNNFYSGE